MDGTQPPDGDDKGPQPKKAKLERATTLAAAAAVTNAEGELTLVSTVDGGNATVTAAAAAPLKPLQD